MAKNIEGTCPRCGCYVWSNQLFTEERGELYHLSCYNKMKKEEEERKRDYDSNDGGGSSGGQGGWFTGW